MPNGYIRDFADPFDGLLMQLDELRGFARTVPPLVEVDRQATWDTIASSPGNGDEDLVDAFARASGEGTGGGFADFSRTAYSAALVLGWELLRDYLALHLAEKERGPRVTGRRTIRDDLELKLTELSLFKLAQRYRRLDVIFEQFAEWQEIREIQFSRNAIVHNVGRYTSEYFKKIESPRYPAADDIVWKFARGLTEKALQEILIDREEIPLDFQYVSTALITCSAFAREINAV